MSDGQAFKKESAHHLKTEESTQIDVKEEAAWITKTEIKTKVQTETFITITKTRKPGVPLTPGFLPRTISQMPDRVRRRSVSEIVDDYLTRTIVDDQGRRTRPRSTVGPTMSSAAHDDTHIYCEGSTGS